MKLIQTSPCTSCHAPNVRKEYRLDGTDKMGYSIKIVEKCSSCGRNYEAIFK